MLLYRGKFSLAKGIAMLVSAFSPNLPNQEPKDLPDLITLYTWVLLSFIPIDRLLGKEFLNLAVCLVVRNNSCDNSSSL